MDKITKGYVNRFDRIKFTQVLSSGRKVYEEYIRKPNTEKWYVQHSSDSAHHICPYDGIFRECVDCEEYENAVDDEDFVEGCLARTEWVLSTELARRCTLCEKGKNCKVDYWSNF